ncbi:MAG TPA: GGDEF domain-containing protein [Lacipirellulaceae bacterium]|jgi:diguanylate cyclase (GGDEF)-like protein|nr:GGDEF domain-containing protein [Lacipirellulaceae bacterium]
MTSTLILLLVALSLAAIGTLSTGFFAGYVCGRWKHEPKANGGGQGNPCKPDEPASFKQVQVVTDSLAHLARSMATDVADHSTKIEEISATISEEAVSAEALALIPARIVAINLELQNQLARAKQQIENQAQQLKARESEARTDLLTSLLNRRAFDEEMRRQMAEWERNQRPFSLLMMDVDSFKHFNDTHGHRAGDAVLREVGHVVGTKLRPMDLAYRYGGEEFAVLLPGIELVNAVMIGERIRKAIAEEVVTHEGKQLHVTVSVGVSSVDASDSTDSLVQRADQALYESKRTSKNCVHSHSVNGIKSANQEKHVVESEPLTNPFCCKQSSSADFKRELTKRVLESRRTGHPLSLIWFRYQSEFEGNEVRLEDFAAFLNPYLSRWDLVSLQCATDAWLVLSDRNLSNANDLLAKLTSGSCAFGQASELGAEESAESLVSRTLLATVSV